MQFEGRWVHCLECDYQAIGCPVCHNFSCTGGGCDVCDKEFDEANKMIGKGTAPDKKGLPKIGMTSEELNRFFKCTMTPEEKQRIEERTWQFT